MIALCRADSKMKVIRSAIAAVSLALSVAGCNIWLIAFGDGVGAYCSADEDCPPDLICSNSRCGGHDAARGRIDAGYTDARRRDSNLADWSRPDTSARDVTTTDGAAGDVTVSDVAAIEDTAIEDVSTEGTSELEAGPEDHVEPDA